MYSAFAFVQSSRLRIASSEISASVAQSEAVGEEQLELALGARLRVGAVDDVLGELVAKSPRIVPGRASAGCVAPIIAADARDRVLAAHGEREHGPEVMNETSSPKNGLPLCSA